MCSAVSRPVYLLGHIDEDLRLHLWLCGSSPHHHGVLHAHGPASQERTSAVGLPGERPQPETHHPSSNGCGGCVCGVLDAHTYLHPGQSSCARSAGDHCGHGRVLLLCGAGIHQQQPEPHPVCVP